MTQYKQIGVLSSTDGETMRLKGFLSTRLEEMPEMGTRLYVALEDDSKKGADLHVHFGIPVTPEAPAEAVLPSREHLVWLCLTGVVPQDQWTDRDSASAQLQLCQALGLLRAGCDFEILEANERVYLVEITYHGFMWFETSQPTKDTFYIPSKAHLDKHLGRDWY